MTISGNTIAHENVVDQNAVDWRRQFQRMLGYDFVAGGGVGAGGVARAGDCAVTQRGAGANMSVDVAAGFVAVNPYSGGTGYDATAGVWTGYNDAVLNVSLTAADPTNARIDRIGFGIRDTAYAGGTDDGNITVITGTPAGSPSLPAIPSTYIAWVDLAHVAVAALATSITNANITDRRQRLTSLGGIRVVATDTDLAAIPSPWAGQYAIVASHSGAGSQRALYTYNGAAWEPAGWAARAWSYIAEVVRGTTGAIQFPAIPQTFRHLRLTGSLRTTRAVVQDTLLMRVNGLGTATYDTEVLFAGAAAGAAQIAAATAGDSGAAPGASANALTFGPWECLIPNYRSTAFGRHWMTKSGLADHTAGNSLIKETINKERGTAALTQIDLLDGTGAGNTFLTGSNVTLEGMR